MALTLFTASTTATGAEPWITDGTAAGTTLLRDLYSGPIGSGAPGYARLSPGHAVFAAAGPVGVPALWATDGTAAGTVQLQIVGGPFGDVSLATLRPGLVVFQVISVGQGTVLWATDGTAAGTAALKTFPAIQAFPAPFTPLGNGRAVFAMDGGFPNALLWTTDGTPAGTVPLKSFTGSIFGFGTLGDGRVLFGANEGTGSKLWATDGTAAGTTLVSGINPAFGSFAPLDGGRVLVPVEGAFDGSGPKSELWASDGTAGGTTPFYVPSAPFSTARDFTALSDGRVAFTASSSGPTSPKELWVTDGTAAGTTRLLALPGSNPESFTGLGGGRFVFRASDADHGAELWVSDGTPAGTALLRDINPGPTGSATWGFTAIGGGRALFQASTGAAGPELWVTDGTPAGTALLRDIQPGTTGSNPMGFLPLNPVALAPAPIRVSGTAADRPGDQTFIGPGTVTFAETCRGAAIATGAADTITLTRAGQTDTLVGIGTLRFLDGSLVFGAGTPAATVTRLYAAALGRAPDQDGLNFWTASGLPAAALARQVLQSPEFAARFGTGLTDEAFVGQLYRNVLGREAEPSGRAYWTGRLAAGDARADVLLSLSESAENKALTAPLVQNGIWDRSEPAAAIARLYDTALGRRPDLPGLAHWLQQSEAGASLEAIAQQFTASPEFAAAYGAPGNRGFVEQLYANTLHRPGDPEGLNHWAAALDAGASRAAVTLGFSESREHQLRTAPDVGGETPDTFGIRLA